MPLPMSNPTKKLALGANDIERLRGLLEQTTDRREKARLRGLLQYATPESRAAHGQLTRVKMNAVIANAPALVVLREARRNAPADIRKKFLSEIVD
jgi:hypothetical protein